MSMTTTESAVGATSSHDVAITVNGQVYRRRVEARLLLSDFLRHELGLTGTHVGCEHGVCGACTVLLDGQPVRSCLMLSVQAAEHEVLTVEGLAGEGFDLTLLQKAFRTHHALQCGYCTPGFLLSATAYLRDNPNPTEAEVRAALSGNLCRCTGYTGIVEAVLDAGKQMNGTTAEEEG